MLYAVLKKKGKLNGKIKSLYIQSEQKQEIFTEMEDFLQQTHKRYNTEVIYGSGQIKSALGMLWVSKLWSYYLNFQLI